MALSNASLRLLRALLGIATKDNNLLLMHNNCNDCDEPKQLRSLIQQTHIIQDLQYAVMATPQLSACAKRLRPPRRNSSTEEGKIGLWSFRRNNSTGEEAMRLCSS